MYITFFADVTPNLQFNIRIFIDLKTLLYTDFSCQTFIRIDIWSLQLGEFSWANSPVKELAFFRWLATNPYEMLKFYWVWDAINLFFVCFFGINKKKWIIIQMLPYVWAGYCRWVLRSFTSLHCLVLRHRHDRNSRSVNEYRIT